MAARLTKSVTFLNLLAVLAAIILVSQTALAQQFVTVNFPGATYTSVNGMDRNNAQVLVGNYVDTEGGNHGFIFTGGSFLTLDYPGATATFPEDVNDLGQVVGQYYDSNNVSHGFLYSGGTFVAKDFPNVISSYAGGINNAGMIVGGYVDTNKVQHGFIYSGGKFSRFDVPGATGTGLAGINNQDHIAGIFSDAKGTHAFLLTGSGNTTINTPGSADTFAQDLNDADEIVGGYYQTGQTNEQAFTYSTGIFTTVVYPGALTTDLTSLSNSGVLTGDYTSDGSSGGFVRTNGPFAYAPIRSANSVSVFDTSTNLQVTSIPVGSGPVGIGLAPSGALAYVANYQGNSVSVIDTINDSAVATIPVGSAPLGVAVTPNGSFVYVANNFSNNVSVISTTSNTVIATVAVGSIPSFVAITPDGNFAYVTNQTSSYVSVISTATNSVVANVAIGAGSVGLAVSPNGQSVYVTVPSTNSVAVISTATDTVVKTIPVGAAPVRISVTPDGTTAYVSNQNSGDVVSVINLASNTVVAEILVGSTPYGSAVTPDGVFDWVIDAGSGQISIISTATNTVAATLSLSGGSDIAIAAAPRTSQTITQPLSPTQPTQFNFGPHNFTVQYPPGTSFSGVNMSVTAAQTTETTFQQRVSGTKFANATCIVYSGAGGNCVDYQVTCSNGSGASIPCPSEPTPDIQVKTSYDTLQAIINPGFLTAPIGTNEWENIFSAFYLQRIDPTTIGRTTGFSEFYAVDLGASNQQGEGIFTFLPPLAPTNPRVFGSGVTVPVGFQLTSITKPSHPITDAVASITVVMVANASGNPESKIVLDLQNAFEYGSGGYLYQMITTGYAAGTYILTVYGNAFAAQQVEFTIQNRAAATCVINSSVQNFSAGQPITFTASVDPVPPATGVPTGSITFVDSGYSQSVLGTAPLVGGSASITAVLPEPSPPRQFIEAVYSGDNNFNVCDSGYITENYTQSYDY